MRSLKAFSGQSLNVPPGASVLMKLSETAREVRNRTDLETVRAAVAGRAAAANDLIDELSEPRRRPGAGGCHDVRSGAGRGAGGRPRMLSAQVSRRGDPPTATPMGMNEPGNDNRQFVLNTLHWLSGLLH